jgi:hypothetical protein
MANKRKPVKYSIAKSTKELLGQKLQRMVGILLANGNL